MTTKDDALKLALEALENSLDLVSHEAREAEKMYANVPTRLARVQGFVALEVAHEKAITTLREALNAPLAEQPVQRTWVGLTNDGINALLGQFPHYSSEWDEFDFYVLARAIEAELKEKNT